MAPLLLTLVKAPALLLTLTSVLIPVGTAIASASPEFSRGDGIAFARRIPDPGYTVSRRRAPEDLQTLLEQRVPLIFQYVANTVPDLRVVSTWVNTWNADGTWPDVNYTTGCDARRANWPAGDHWIRINAITSAYLGGLPQEPSTRPFVNNATVRDAISRAMDWWYDRDFTNPDCLSYGGQPRCPCGSAGLWNTNWFSNMILVPRLAGHTCVQLNSTLTPTQLGNCTKFTSRTYASFWLGSSVGIPTGANALEIAHIGLSWGITSANETAVTDAYDRIHSQMVIMDTTFADGIRRDGSFAQHAGILYNGNYGKDYVNAVLELELQALNTPWAAGPVGKHAFVTYVDGFQWTIYRNVIRPQLHWDFSTEGRFIMFPVADNQATASLKINITQISELGSAWGEPSLPAVVNRLNTITNNANAGSLFGTRMFYTNDYFVHRGNGYVSSVKMFSTRTRNTECVNTQNPLGFHLSDGTLYTYLNGNEYEDIAAAWDWNLIPGTTTDYAATPLACATTERVGVEAFVGGVSDGEVGIAVLNYTNPLTRNFNFRKTWFFLSKNRQHVTISGIHSLTAADVYSVLDQKRYESSGGLYVNNQPVTGSGLKNFTSASTLWHGNVGYVLNPASTHKPRLSVRTGDRTGNWTSIGTSVQPPITVNLFAGWIVHDPTRLNVSTSYTIYPGHNRNSFNSIRLKETLQEASNTPQLSAVLDSDNGAAYAVFFAPGEAVFPPATSIPNFLRFPIRRISADAAVAVILRREDREWKITVADPSQTLRTATVTVSVELGKQPKWWGLQIRKSVRFELPGGGDAGKSLTKRL